MLRRTKVLLLATALILTLACVPTLGSTPAPLPTFDPNAPLTAIVETANAAATQTAVSIPPTETPIPATKTPFPTATATMTFIIIPPTSIVPPTLIPLGNSNKQYDCQLLGTEPKRALQPNEAFTAKWIVANIGLANWDGNSLDYSYKEGEKVHINPAYDFPVDVAPGVVVELKAEMLAPETLGNFVTIWHINYGKSSFCDMTLNFTVQK
ncbi:MAG: hypothetical protein H6635_12505 [Anaerolineales bacterium]|nr:hypothetical protein [Anaerolineales bacterium]MCB9146190.1 hypothetical protein [Anaerolineales bacterium]